MTIQSNGRKVVLGNRKIPLPVEVKEIHDSFKVHGDYKMIADMIPSPVVGITKISRTIKSGFGEPEIVKAIVDFYNAVKHRNDLYESSAE